MSLYNKDYFYRGLLLAICEQGYKIEREYLTEMFRNMLENMVEKQFLPEVARHMLENYDPVFNHFPATTEMFLIGQRDFICRMIDGKIEPKLSKENAKKELEEFGNAEEFRKLAVFFKDYDEVKLDEFHYHEILDRTFMIMDSFNTYVYEHSAVKQNPKLTEQAKKVFDELHEMYTLCGNCKFEEENED